MQQQYSLTFLGVGAGLSPELGNNNVLIESKDRQTNLLIDCGPVTAHDLKLAGRLRDIQHVFITHVHDDHVGGLQLWAQLNRYVFRNRPHLYFREELWEELWPAGMRGGLGRVSGPDGEPLEVGLEGYFEVHPLAEGEVLRIEGLPVLTPRRSVHVPGKPSFGIYLGEDVFYSSDTQELPPALGPTGQPLKTIFQDCQLFDTPRSVHTSLQRLEREMPAELKAITRLMHYNHPPEQDACALGFHGWVQPAEPIWF